MRSAQNSHSGRPVGVLPALASRRPQPLRLPRLHCGARSFPVPGGHETRVLTAANAWLRQMVQSGRLGQWTTGDSKPPTFTHAARWMLHTARRPGGQALTTAGDRTGMPSGMM